MSGDRSRGSDGYAIAGREAKGKAGDGRAISRGEIGRVDDARQPATHAVARQAGVTSRSLWSPGLATFRSWPINSSFC